MSRSFVEDISVIVDKTMELGEQMGGKLINNMFSIFLSVMNR